MGQANDLISRQAAIEAVDIGNLHRGIVEALQNIISELPSAQQEDFEWCHDCKEYDQTEHCCHRWAKVIRETIKELKDSQPEIVACGDCKHWICHDRRCGYWNHGVKPLDWCSYAERKTDG